MGGGSPAWVICLFVHSVRAGFVCGFKSTSCNGEEKEQGNIEAIAEEVNIARPRWSHGPVASFQ